ncbi:DNA-processing protein DprA [Flagellimonas sp.]|uniref:DNA-processing protein DprA n=1 Tax=Flagellimonas sp. TaxID=2058762 RepID=UPI003B524878
MQATLYLNKSGNPFNDSIEPIKEMAAYEALWKNKGVSFKKLAEFFANNPDSRPSDLVEEKDIEEFYQYIKTALKDFLKKNKPNFLINSTFDYPLKLRDAKEPIELLYYQGNLELINSRSIAIVGTRKPTDYGRRRARKLVKLLVNDGFTIVSGLAQGIDTEAHSTAIDSNGNTIAVIGTPLNKYYPKENKELQQFIAQEHLLLSQVPFWRYEQQSIRGNRLFFPERNKTMSALTEATVIIEAGETSGTLIQAKAALYQKRKLFILESNFQNPKITWPSRFEKEGAIRVKDYNDIINALNSDVSETPEN